jgi:hypothetical protein
MKHPSAALLPCFQNGAMFVSTLVCRTVRLNAGTCPHQDDRTAPVAFDPSKLSGAAKSGRMMARAGDPPC